MLLLSKIQSLTIRMCEAALQMPIFDIHHDRSWSEDADKLPSEGTPYIPRPPTPPTPTTVSPSASQLGVTIGADMGTEFPATNPSSNTTDDTHVSDPGPGNDRRPRRLKSASLPPTKASLANIYSDKQGQANIVKLKLIDA